MMEKKKRGNGRFLKLDTRTLLILILLVNVTIFITGSADSEIFLMVLTLGLGILCGIPQTAFKLGITYALFVGVDYFIMVSCHQGWLVAVAVGMRFVRKVFPTGTLGMILLKTCSVSECMASLNKMKMPSQITIPLAVLLRYFPTIHEDKTAICKAMAMRGLNQNYLRHPVRTIECIYVPIMMAASRRADELSCAAVTRAIENPKRRTNLHEVRMGIFDWICIVVAVSVTVYCIAGG